MKLTREEIGQVFDWCEERFGRQGLNWDYRPMHHRARGSRKIWQMFDFKKEADAVLFALKWS